MNFFNILFAIGKLVHLWKQLPKCHGRVAFLAAKHSQIGYIIQTLRGYLCVQTWRVYLHSNFQCDICFIRISNDVDFYAVFPMISLVLTASFLVFLSIFSFLHQNIYNVRRPEAWRLYFLLTHLLRISFIILAKFLLSSRQNFNIFLYCW